MGCSWELQVISGHYGLQLGITGNIWALWAVAGNYRQYTLGNVPHVYYMCDTHILHVWQFWCISCVILTPVIYVSNTCNSCFIPVIQMYILHMYYMCRNTSVIDMQAIHMKYTCSTHVIHLKHHICITGVAQLVVQ